MTVYEAKTKDAAITRGLMALGLTQEDVTIEVLDEGRRGFLGLGARPARVELTEKPVVAAPTPEPEVVAAPAPTAEAPAQRDNDAAIAAVTDYLTATMAAMDLPGTVTATKQRGGVTFDLHTEKEALLIGKHGRTINSLQVLAQTLFARLARSRRWQVVLNVGDYRQRREATLNHLAERSAREVIASGKPVYLDPMPSFERKILHEALADSTYVETRSEGADPRRFVVIVPQRR